MKEPKDQTGSTHGMPVFFPVLVDLLPRDARIVECGTYQGDSALLLTWLLVQAGKTPAWFRTYDVSGGGMNERFREHEAPEALQAERESSPEVAERHEDGSLDCVFLDDDHEYAQVLAECRAWWPKLKLTGILCGHDYEYYPEKRAVDQFAAEQNLRVELHGCCCWMLRP